MPSGVATPSDAEYLRALIEAAPEAVISMDADGRVTLWNPAAERIFGWTADEALGHPLPFVPPEQREEHERIRERVVAHGEAFTGVEVLRVRRDGTRVPISISAAPIRDPAGRVVGVLSLAADVSDQKRAEAALTESEGRFRTVVEMLGEGIVITDLEDRILYTNPRNAEITGYSPEELIGRKSEIMLPPAELESFRARIQGRAQGETGRYELQQLRKDGTLIWTEVCGSPLRDAAGAIVGTVGAVTDITERKAMEEALVRNEARFRALIEHTSDLVYILGPDATVRYIGPSVEPVLGFPPEEVTGRSATELVHPDDQARVWEAFTDHFGETPDSGRGTVVLRLRHRDGSWRTFEAVGTRRLDDPAVRGVIVNARDVTGRLEAEAAMRRLAAIVESSSDAILSKSLDGTILSWNRAAERIYGYTAAEVLGRSILLLFPPELVHEEGWIREQIAAGLALENHETVRVRKDGSRVEISLSVAPIRGEGGRITSASIVARDITTRRRTEAELRASNDRYRLASRATNDVIWDWDLVADTLQWGEAIHATFGYPPEQVADDVDWWSERIHPDDVQEVTASLGAALRQGVDAWKSEYRFRRADGSYATVLDRGYVLRDEDATPLRLIGSMTDMSERIEVERELRRAKEAAEAANRAKSEFLSSMSHELRTPLNSVIGFTNVLRKNKAGNLREQDLMYLDRIHANGKHLLGLINDVLDLSKIEAGKMEVEAAPVELNTLIQETLSELQGSVRRGVELRMEVPMPLAPLETDARKLKQILINLVGNALKFTEAGRVVVSVEAEADSRRPVRIAVSDTGVGIAADRLQAIFEAFEQGEGGTTRRFGGTGLGLAISSALSRLLGYRIEVQSESGRGSVFGLHLAPDTRADPDPFAGDERAPAEEPGALRGKRVLIVDDEEDSRLLIALCVRDEGMEVRTAANGREALMLLREFSPELVFLDLLMPDMDGEEFLARLRQERPALRPAVVVVTARDLSGEELGRLRGQVSAVVHKSGELEAELKRQLLEILERTG